MWVRAALTWLGALSAPVGASLLALSQPPPAATSTAAAAEIDETGFARPPAPWPAAATAFRTGDPAAARRLIEPLIGDDGATAREAYLVLGLWALAESEFDRGAALLRSAAERDGRFEDWRLLALADCHAALGRLPAATAMLARLLDSRPGSPLRGPAALRAAEHASQLGDRNRVEEMVALGRREQLAPEEIEQLERAAWRVAVDSGDQELQRTVARRLLVHLPILASKLPSAHRRLGIHGLPGGVDSPQWASRVAHPCRPELWRRSATGRT
ncbi:MAG: tol-pal system YbgF family protein, partial [Thermoanaerobaculia bacterium]